MTIVIKNQKRLSDGSYGVTHFLSVNRIHIKMNLEKNETVAEYGCTLLHELLHAWLKILKLHGAKFDSRKEHKFIYATEAATLKLMKKFMKGKRNEEKKTTH